MDSEHDDVTDGCAPAAFAAENLEEERLRINFPISFSFSLSLAAGMDLDGLRMNQTVSSSSAASENLDRKLQIASGYNRLQLFLVLLCSSRIVHTRSEARHPRSHL